MSKKNKPKPTAEELIKKHEEFLKEKGYEDISEEDFEETLKKLLKKDSEKEDKK